MFLVRYKGEQKAKQSGDSGKQNPKVKKVRPPLVTSTISIPPPTSLMDSSALPKSTVMDSIPVSVSAQPTGLTLVAPTSLTQTQSVANRNKPLTTQSRLASPQLSVPPQQLPIVPTQQFPVWLNTQGHGQIPPQFWSHYPAYPPMPAYQAPYWNFQTQPLLWAPVPPHLSADPSGSRNQPPLMPPPANMVKRSVKMDTSRESGL